MEIKLNKKEKLQIFTDGAARGNPGPAASAFLLIQESQILYSDVKFIGDATNNIAEYQAIINALTYSQNYFNGYVSIFSDSNLAIQQINRNWKINYPHLSTLQKKVLELSKRFENVEFLYISRNNPYIQQCDKLCNQKLDEKL